MLNIDISIYVIFPSTETFVSSYSGVHKYSRLYTLEIIEMQIARRYAAEARLCTHRVLLAVALAMASEAKKSIEADVKASEKHIEDHKKKITGNKVKGKITGNKGKGKIKGKSVVKKVPARIVKAMKKVLASMKSMKKVG